MTEHQASPKIRIVVGGLVLYAMLSLISMATMGIGAGILLACLVYYSGCPRGFLTEFFRRIRSNPVICKFAGISIFFASMCVLSLVVARFWPLSVGNHFSVAHPLKDSAKLWYFAWPFVLWHALELCDSRQRRFVLYAWLGTFLALSVLAMFQHFYGWPRPQNIPSDWAHFHATLFLGHHLSVASILIFPFFAWLDLPGIAPARRLLGAAVGFVGLMLTYSRMLWIALPIGLVFWTLLRLKWRGRIAVALLLVVGAGAAYQVPTIRKRVQFSDGVQERRDLWEANWSLFEHRPFTGVGLRHNEDLSGFYLMEKYHTQNVFQGHAHNNFLDVLSTTGIFGALGFLGWWVFLIWILVIEIRGRKGGIADREFFGRGLLAALFVYQLNGLTQVNFWEGKVQHQLMWMVAWILLWQGEWSES